MANRNITVAPSSTELNNRLQSIIKDAWSSFLSANNPKSRFTVAVSGGSLIDILADVLSSIDIKEEGGKRWQIYFVDERLVDFNHSESTYGGYVRKLLPRVSFLNTNNFVSINTFLLRDPAAMADDYEEHVKKNLGEGVPSLDLILLGMGPDGHTASLFPNHELLKENVKLIAPITDSPKPPPSRITFTLPLINAGKRIVVVTTGSSKAEMIAKIVKRDPSEDIPVSLVAPSQGGSLEWLIDSDAGKLL